MNADDAMRTLLPPAVRELTSWMKSWNRDPLWRAYIVDLAAGRRDILQDIRDLLESLKVR